MVAKGGEGMAASKNESEKEGAEKKRRSVKSKSTDAATENGGRSMAPVAAAELTQEKMIIKYLSVFERCMQEDPKSFDAKGALSALDQISKILGLDTPIQAADIEGNKVILTLSDKVGDRGD